MAENNPLRIIRKNEVRRKTGMGDTWLNEAIKTGNFPQPIALGVRSIGFIESEVDDWIEARIAASRGGVSNV